MIIRVKLIQKSQDVFLTLRLEALLQYVCDVLGFSHSVEVDCGCFVLNQVFALLDAPFCSYLIYRILVVLELCHLLG